MTADIAQGWAKLSIEEQNMFINKANAVTNARNSHINAMNARTNAFRLEWEKTIKDVSDSTRLTVETVTDIFKSILGAATKSDSGNETVKRTTLKSDCSDIVTGKQIGRAHV